MNQIYAIRFDNNDYYGGAYIKMHSDQQSGYDKIEVSYERIDEAFLFKDPISAQNELDRVKEALRETLERMDSAHIVEGDFKGYE